MANTTDIMIVCSDESEVITDLSRRTEIDFKLVSDGGLAGGPKVLSITAYGACYRSLGKEKIDQLIYEFKKADFMFPELAVMVIDDDDQCFNGTVLTPHHQP